MIEMDSATFLGYDVIAIIAGFVSDFATLRSLLLTSKNTYSALRNADSIWDAFWPWRLPYHRNTACHPYRRSLDFFIHTRYSCTLCIDMCKQVFLNQLSLRELTRYISANRESLAQITESLNEVLILFLEDPGEMLAYNNRVPNNRLLSSLMSNRWPEINVFNDASSSSDCEKSGLLSVVIRKVLSFAQSESQQLLWTELIAEPQSQLSTPLSSTTSQMLLKGFELVGSLGVVPYNDAAVRQFIEDASCRCWSLLSPLVPPALIMMPMSFAMRKSAVAGLNRFHVIAALNHVFFEDLGMHGNSASYYDMCNSFLDVVILRRKGRMIISAGDYEHDDERETQ